MKEAKAAAISVVVLTAITLDAGCVSAQTSLAAITPTPSATPKVPVAAPISVPQKTTMHVPEGTEMGLRLQDKLSYSTSTEGDTFGVVSDEEILIPEGTVPPEVV